MARKTKSRARTTRESRLLAGYLPQSVIEGIEAWVEQNPERDVSQFIREAAAEKLRREGVRGD